MKNSIISVETIHEELEGIRLNCKTDADFLALNAKIEATNADLYTRAVEVVATSENLVAILLTEPAVSQFASVENNGESVALKKNMRAVTYSTVASFIKKHNKAIDKGEKSGEKLALPFTNADYVLFNIYGANLSKETLSTLDIKSLKKLASFVPSLECFKASSNSKLKEQLCHLYTRVEEVASVPNGVKAIERNSKLIAMEFIKYKSSTHKITINSADKLIDCIIAQYIISRDNRAITVKSSLDIHKEEKSK